MQQVAGLKELGLHTEVRLRALQQAEDSTVPDGWSRSELRNFYEVLASAKGDGFDPASSPS